MDSAANINWLFNLINTALHDANGNRVIETVVPEPTSIDPSRFNRMMMKIDGTTYTISVFEPAQVPFEAVEPDNTPPLELTTELSAGIRIFSQDHRANPKLHKLYIAWALHDLEILQRFLEEMREVSRWPMSHLAHVLQSALGEEILNDAAWFEAAALLFARVDTSEYEQLGRTESMAPHEAETKAGD